MKAIVWKLWHKVRKLFCKVGIHRFETECDNFVMDVKINFGEISTILNAAEHFVAGEDIIERCIYCGEARDTGWNKAAWVE